MRESGVDLILRPRWRERGREGGKEGGIKAAAKIIIIIQ